MIMRSPKIFCAPLILMLMLVSNAFAGVSVDKQIPYRLLIGSEYAGNWVDIKTLTSIDSQGKIKITYQDKTPIQAVYEDWVCFIIVKKKSVWKLWKGQTSEDWCLQLVLRGKEAEFGEFMDYLLKLHNYKLVYQRSI